MRYDDPTMTRPSLPPRDPGRGFRSALWIPVALLLVVSATALTRQFLAAPSGLETGSEDASGAASTPSLSASRLPGSAGLLESRALSNGPQEGRRRNRVDMQRVRPRRYHPYEMPLMPDDDPVGSPPVSAARPPSEFYFTRVAYSGYSMRGFASWSVDYPKADRLFMAGVGRLVNHLDLYEYENPILLTDPQLSGFPFLYAVEVGYMSLSDDEVAALRRYLLAGGFLLIDDFWGSWEWQNLSQELRRVLPDHSVVDLPLDHPIFHCFYDVREIVQVPNLAQGRSGGPTWERDGYDPTVRGVFDQDGRLMVVINWNSDLGDAWEWADDPYYPLRFSTYAYQMGVNYIVYAMSH